MDEILASAYDPAENIASIFAPAGDGDADEAVALLREIEKAGDVAIPFARVTLGDAYLGLCPVVSRRHAMLAPDGPDRYRSLRSIDYTLAVKLAGAGHLAGIHEIQGRHADLLVTPIGASEPVDRAKVLISSYSWAAKHKGLAVVSLASIGEFEDAWSRFAYQTLRQSLA